MWTPSLKTSIINNSLLELHGLIKQENPLSPINHKDQTVTFGSTKANLFNQYVTVLISLMKIFPAYQVWHGDRFAFDYWLMSLLKCFQSCLLLMQAKDMALMVFVELAKPLADHFNRSLSNGILHFTGSVQISVLACFIQATNIFVTEVYCMEWIIIMFNRFYLLLESYRSFSVMLSLVSGLNAL